MNEEKKFTYEQLLEKHGKIVYRNIGTSMLPLIRQKRDLMIIVKRPEERLKKYDAVLYKTNQGKYILHRIIKVNTDDYVICGDNCIHREFGIKDRQIIGILTAVVRDNKTINTSDKKYRIYVHLICDFFYIKVVVLYVKQLFYRIISKIKKRNVKQ